MIGLRNLLCFYFKLILSVKKNFIFYLIIGLAIQLNFSCTNKTLEQQKTANIQKADYGETEDGKNVNLYTLTNNNNMQVKITDFGGIITSVVVPDKDGKLADVVLGFDSLDGYLGKHPFFGALVGRYANRINQGKFTLNGKEYVLAQNDGENHLHGGIKGFDKVLWNSEIITTEAGPSLKLTYFSKDGEEGYPGNLNVAVLYTLNDNNEIVIEYKAETDSPTHVNLTNHSYFNLDPDNSEDIHNHILEIKADKYTVVNQNLIPTGELKTVEGPMDFRKPKKIGLDIEKVGIGYDHNYVLNKTGTNLELMATVYEPNTGRTLDVFTTQPGLQFYSGNYLNGLKGKNDLVYNKRAGFCLETQHFPDTPNQPDFPTTVLNPGEEYYQTTIYRFGVK